MKPFREMYVYLISNQNIITMTKKEFNEMTSYHQYGKRNESGIIALFFDWKTTDEGVGFKYCVFARALNSNKKELTDALYNLVFNETDTPWHINCAIAPTDKQRFKVPIMSSGIRSLVKYEPVRS